MKLLNYRVKVIKYGAETEGQSWFNSVSAGWHQSGYDVSRTSVPFWIYFMGPWAICEHYLSSFPGSFSRDKPNENDPSQPGQAIFPQLSNIIIAEVNLTASSSSISLGKLLVIAWLLIYISAPSPCDLERDHSSL